MVDKQPDKDAARTTPADSPPAAPENYDQQIGELRELTRSLLVAVQAMQVQSTRNQEFQNVISDVKAATRAMLTTPPVVATDRHTVGVEQLHGEQNCDCSPCGCISERCCAFDVIFSEVRVVDMQIEPVDSNILPFNLMEVQLFASINGKGIMVPDMFGFLSLHKLINRPGVWSQVNRVVDTVYVCKGQPKSFTIRVDGKEIEEGVLEQATALRDEYGTASAVMTLDCNCCTPPVLTFELDFEGGGQGGGTLEMRFTAAKKC